MILETGLWIRSTIFHLVFYVYHMLLCVLGLPFLVMGRRALRTFILVYLRSVEALERGIMGLTCEIRGLENIPAQGSFLVAAKHQSAYETFKLHLLFQDPAIVLKRELLKIPLWGAFLSAIDPIAIDRAQGRSAMEQVIAGARAVQAQGRPIVIFPQGTRVGISQSPAERPYKMGIVRMQEATGLPIVPMALNTGYFWPRKGWKLRSGRVIFEFLPPIPAQSRPPEETLKYLQDQLERASHVLVEEARNAEGKPTEL